VRCVTPSVSLYVTRGHSGYLGSNHSPVGHHNLGPERVHDGRAQLVAALHGDLQVVKPGLVEGLRLVFDVDVMQSVMMVVVGAR